MAQVVLVSGGRGGVGKSTICAFLGEALAGHGKTVLLWEGSHRSLDVLFGMSDGVLFDLSDAVAQRCELTDAMLCVGAGGRLRLLCAPLEEDFLPDSELCGELLSALDPHFDYIFIEVDGQDSSRLAAYATIADRAILVSTADRVSARVCRCISDMLAAQGVGDIRLCVNMLSNDFVRLRPIPDLDWLIDSICAQLICVIPFDRTLASVTAVGHAISLSNLSKMIFDNFAQRIMGNYIDLLVQ
ncbi:cellulose synthase operon protein YhjQ/BcsQ [Oscillospiraceae bacterium PP1C4]